ncbi:MAG: hypothetical protein U0T85_07975 [Cloacibacterium normanense]
MLVFLPYLPYFFFKNESFKWNHLAALSV